jgi:hypothetical protein
MQSKQRQPRQSQTMLQTIRSWDESSSDPRSLKVYPEGLDRLALLKVKLQPFAFGTSTVPQS